MTPKIGLKLKMSSSLRRTGIIFAVFFALLVSESAISQASTDAGKPTAKQAVPLSELPTQREAAWKAKKEPRHVDGATLEEIEAAVKTARQAEIKAITSGHIDLVAPEDLEDCRKSMARKVALDAETEARKAWTDTVAKSDAAHKEAKERELVEARKKSHCPSFLSIGISEECVYLLMGYPDRTNEDLRTGKQLVYSNDRYVYIDLRGRVENIQFSR